MTAEADTDPRAAARAALLRQRLRQRRHEQPTIARRPDGAPPPLSFAQERLWFMDQFAPDTAAYTVPFPLRLRGPLDIGALRRALDTVVARHESLRMRFPATPDGRPAAVVGDALEVPLDIADAPDEAAAVDLLTAATAEPFDLAAGPLVRARLVRLAGDDHVLLVVVHHVVFDGWSIDVFLRDLWAAYAGQPVAEEATRYGDYAAWQRATYVGEGVERDLAYWRERLAGVPPLDMPTDAARPPEQTYRGGGHPLTLGPDVASDVLELSRRHGVTPYMTLLAAYETMLYRTAGQDDFAVGSTVAGRTLPELEGTVGLFANVLPLRADLSGNPTFAEVLTRVRDTVLDAFAHADAQFDRIVSELRLPRDVSRTPVFQATLTLLNYGQSAAAPSGLSVERFPLHNTVTRFDLELYLYEPDGGITGFFTYNADLFTPDTIARMTRHLARIVDAVRADPTVRVADIDLLDPAERGVVLDGWNDTSLDIGEPLTLADGIAAQAARTPDAVAVRFEDTTLTYADLLARADALAAHLRGMGVGPGDLVAICAERSAELVVGLLGILRAGGAYLPLDPGYPAGRLDLLLRDATPRAVLIGPGVPLADGVRLDRPDTWMPGPSGPAAGVDDLAYCIYTSGSTGRPKGVLVTHRAIHNRLDWMRRTFPLTPDDVVLQKTPYTFDVSVWEFFWPLLVGARLVLARPGGHKDAAYLAELIRAAGVTTVHFVPSMLAVFLTEPSAAACGSLRRVMCSGEALPVRVARSATQLLGCDLFNLYGPTEAAVDVSWWHCEPAALAGLARVPIGRPIQNIRLYVLDTRRRPVPPGLPGELYIAGVGLARGYLRRPDLTAERFVPDPYGPPGGRMYATGDLARHRPDGTLEYLGRLDDQVKLRGVRIEPGEIEAALRDQPGVRDAAVILREDKPGDQRLAAYVVPSGAPPDPATLRSALKATLPDFLVPSAFVVLDALPVTANGKLDRRALPVPVATAAAAFTAPRTELEGTVAGVWRTVLGCERVGIDDDFFDLGGHSLLATQVVARLRTALPAGSAPVGVMDLFTHPTVRQLAELAGRSEAERGPRLLLHELTRPTPVDRRTLSLICVPYGGGSAVVYRPLADALPPGFALYSLAIPGHDIGLDEEHQEFGSLVDACVAEVLDRVPGPIAVYGHCGVGGALAVAVAIELEKVGRRVESVYTGAILPFARPPGKLTALRSRLERWRSDRAYSTWLTSLGIDLSGLGTDQLRTVVRSMRADSEAAEEYFTALMKQGTARLRAPIVSVVGERDGMTEFYQERYREWHFLTGTTALVVLDEAGHFFLKHRSVELAAVIAGSWQGSYAQLPAQDATATWWLGGVSTGDGPQRSPGPQPSMRRFLVVAGGQLVSLTGSAMTEFAVPIWIYIHTHSLVRMALYSAIALVPGIVVLPLAGALVDRYSRRAVMLAGDIAAGATQAVFLALLLTGGPAPWQLYTVLAVLSVALTFQRLAYFSAVPQLVPKRYLGHANGVVQSAAGVAQFLVPVVAAGLLATIGLRAILGVDVVTYAVVIVVVALTRFPRLMAARRRESVAAEIRTGFRYAVRRRGFPAMLLFFAGINLFLGPLFILTQPLVLGFGTLSTVTKVAIAAGLGVTCGGVAMALWGGPAKRRMAGMLGAALALSAMCVVTGLRGSLPVAAAGAFGMSAGLTVMNAIYATIVQVKVPSRYHGRVFAVQTLLAWCTLPIGFVLVGPFASDRFTPLLRDGHSALAGSVGRLIGVGPGRGIGLTYLVFGLLIAAIVVVSWWHPALRHFDRDVPDAEADDVVGLAELARRTGAAGHPPQSAVERAP